MRAHHKFNTIILILNFLFLSSCSEEELRQSQNSQTKVELQDSDIYCSEDFESNFDEISRDYAIAESEDDYRELNEKVLDFLEINKSCAQTSSSLRLIQFNLVKSLASQLANTETNDLSDSPPTSNFEEVTDVPDDSEQIVEVPDNAICSAEGTGPQSNDYYTLPSIVAHGSGSNVIQWSSATDSRLQNPSDQNIFLTDGRFNVRVLALPSPGQGVDSYGNSCQYMALPYTKLRVKVGIRVPGSSTYVSTYTFDNIDVNSCSAVREFNLPQINNPFIVEVLETKWDYSCLAYAQEGFPDHPTACPWDYVWKNDCFEVQVQIATSYTKDIPR